MLTRQIKHTDENTGQIKENVWEFQHPNFQAGGKADLDSIKVSRSFLSTWFCVVNTELI